MTSSSATPQTHRRTSGTNTLILLTVKVENGQTDLGLFKGAELLGTWSATTNEFNTPDELALMVHSFLSMRGLPRPQDSILGSVVPSLTGAWVIALRDMIGKKPLVIGPGVKTGLAMDYKDPAQVGLGLSWNFGESGTVIAQIAEANDAVLAINASGFYDPEGQGNGGTPHGLVVKDGQHLWDWVDEAGDKVIGFDWNDQLNSRNYSSESAVRDAVQLNPVLVLNGQSLISGSSGWGMQPRSAIGQTGDGQVLLLVVDGRQPGYSIGCTMGDLAEIMVRYGAQQASNLDGGSSSIMYYNGRKITRPSGGDKVNGRLLPNAFIVSRR